MKKTWAVLTGAAVLSVVASSANAADLVANYLFNGNLNSSVGGAPALVLTDPTNSSGFVTDTVFGNSRTVLAINGTSANDRQGGLTFDSTGLLTSDNYSVALTFLFGEGTNAWRRIVDVEERQSDNGFYVVPDNNLNVFPVAGSGAAFTTGAYRNVVLTVGPSGPNNVHAYIDGGASLTATTDIMRIGSNGLVNLFLDNLIAGGQNEWSSSRIAVASFYNGVLTADEVFAIDRNPIGVPEPATWAMMIMGFGSIGATVRRRRTALA